MNDHSSATTDGACLVDLGGVPIAGLINDDETVLMTTLRRVIADANQETTYTISAFDSRI